MLGRLLPCPELHTAHVKEPGQRLFHDHHPPMGILGVIGCLSAVSTADGSDIADNSCSKPYAPKTQALSRKELKRSKPLTRVG